MGELSGRGGGSGSCVEGWNSIDFIDRTKISINSMILRIGKLFVSFLGLNASTISLNIVCFE